MVFVSFLFLFSCLGGEESKSRKETGRECETREGGIEKGTPRIVSREKTETS